jgi:predicted nucleic acid-binding protein
MPIAPGGPTAGRVAVATSALLALANPRDQYHSQAVATARRFLEGGGRWIGTPLVLAELHTHLLHRRGSNAARTVLGALLTDSAYQWIEVGAGLIRDAAARWLERFPDQRFSLTDAVSFEVMRREKLTAAFAYDRDFETAGFELLK